MLASKPRTTVLIADSQHLFADCLGIALRDASDFQIFAGRPTGGIEAVEAAARLRPNVALLDYWLPGMEGPAAASAIRSRSPGVNVVLLSGFRAPKDRQAAKDGGAAGFLLKDAPLARLIEVIRLVASGHKGFIDDLQPMHDESPAGAQADDVRQRLFSMTPRELEILRLLGAGLALGEVAAHLGVTLKTVEKHVHNILTKTGARSQLEALALARRHGVIRT